MITNTLNVLYIGFITEALKKLRGKMSKSAEEPTDPETGAGRPGVEGQVKADEAEEEAAVQVNRIPFILITRFPLPSSLSLFSLRLRYLNTSLLTRQAKKPGLSAASSSTARNDANRKKKQKRIRRACHPRAFCRKS